MSWTDEEAKRIEAGFQQLLGNVTEVRRNGTLWDPESVTLVYADGKEVTIHGGGDYCASSSVSIELERSARE